MPSQDRQKCFASFEKAIYEKILTSETLILTSELNTNSVAYETRMFIAAVTNICYWILSRVTSSQFSSRTPTYRRFLRILNDVSVFPTVSFHPAFQPGSNIIFVSPASELHSLLNLVVGIHYSYNI